MNLEGIIPPTQVEMEMHPALVKVQQKIGLRIARVVEGGTK